MKDTEENVLCCPTVEMIVVVRAAAVVAELDVSKADLETFVDDAVVISVLLGTNVVVDTVGVASFARSASTTVTQIGLFSKTRTGKTLRVAREPRDPTVTTDLLVLLKPFWSDASTYVTVRMSLALTLINPSSAAPVSAVGTVSKVPA